MLQNTEDVNIFKINTTAVLGKIHLCHHSLYRLPAHLQLAVHVLLLLAVGPPCCSAGQ